MAPHLTREEIARDLEAGRERGKGGWSVFLLVAVPGWLIGMMATNSTVQIVGFIAAALGALFAIGRWMAGERVSHDAGVQLTREAWDDVRGLGRGMGHALRGDLAAARLEEDMVDIAQEIRGSGDATPADVAEMKATGRRSLQQIKVLQAAGLWDDEDEADQHAADTDWDDDEADIPVSTLPNGPAPASAPPVEEDLLGDVMRGMEDD